ncbi:MAG: hypothetical protein QOE70_386, partial [Chthoniobacter sp.]|nr:hypothetical protein [Chthoniobacter sp.]
MSQPIHSFMRMQPPTYQSQPERKPSRSAVRTAAIAAGGAGLAYGGVQVGRAAKQVRKTAAVAEDSAKKSAEVAENARVITGKVRKAGRIVTAPVRAAKRVLGFDAAPGKPNVARDRYTKQIKDTDLDRAEGHYVRSGLAGAALGLGLRKGSSRKMAALKGALGGVAAQGAVRAVTEGTKDSFGDRSHGAKTADRLPAPALAAAALVAGTPRARAAVKRGVNAIPRVARAMAKKIVGFNARRALTHGAALAGGITTADILTGAIVPEDGHTRAETAKKGLVKGAIYGTT